MANSENLEKHKFKKGQSGNPAGRPKNRVVNQWLPACLGKKRAKNLTALTAEEVDAWEQKLLIASLPELTSVAKWEDCPVYAKSLALAMLFDAKNGKTTTVDKLRERQYGAITSKVEVAGLPFAGLLMQGDSLRAEDIDAEIKRLETFDTK